MSETRGAVRGPDQLHQLVARRDAIAAAGQVEEPSSGRAASATPRPSRSLPMGPRGGARFQDKTMLNPSWARFALAECGSSLVPFGQEDSPCTSGQGAVDCGS